MNIVIDTMIAFVDATDTETLNQGIADASAEYDLYAYTLESVRLLGITPAPVTNVPIPTITATP